MAKDKSTKLILEQALFKQLSTTVDGGWKLVLEFDQSQALSLQALATFRERILNLEVTIPDEN